MELSPQAVAAATFKTVKRGYDPDEVRAYLVEVSASLESSHQQATAMEARARAAIAKLQDATQHAGAAPVPEEAETISRVLLLAQRTADTTIAEARAEAASVTAKAEVDAAAAIARAEAEAANITTVARAEATAMVDQANTAAGRLIEEARAEARRTKDEEHLRLEREVRSLHSRREALLADVHVLETFVSSERDRLRSAASALRELADDPTGGLGITVPPELAASGDLPAPPAEPPAPAAAPAAEAPAPAAAPAAEAEAMPPPVPEPTITGQIPIVGAQPLVSPMPTSNEEARSMWHEAELADAAAAANDDTVGIDPTPHAEPSIDLDAMAAELHLDDESTPSEGLRIGGDELS
jgi:DivIVA domain-containing protein